MKAVGIRELKTHLSKYMKDIKKGNEIIVSDRGKAIARIIPIEGSEKRAKLQTLLLKLSEENKIVLPPLYRRPSRPTLRKKVRGSPFSEAVKEDRR